ncbi:unnamed protein product [Symbiodinium sp. KB8]|nr:unnamed protein product [Symbiodinium sp. KB8]
MDRAAGSDQMAIPLTPPFQPHAVQVVSSTWARDSHDLFDFEAHHLYTKTFTVLQSMVCVRNGTEVMMMKENASMPLGSDPLLRIIQKDGLFWVDKASPNTASKKLWRVVRDGQPSGHILTEGDIIKLGRFKFKVRQLGMNPASQPELRLEDAGGGIFDASHWIRVKLKLTRGDFPETCQFLIFPPALQRTEELKGEIAKLKAKVEEIETKKQGEVPADPAGDRWAEYLQNRNQGGDAKRYGMLATVV